MASREDSEIRELAEQVLQKNGCLDKIKAELRSQLFLSMEENGSFENLRISNEVFFKNILSKPDGILMINIIRDFLSCFKLSFTQSVLEPELKALGSICPDMDRNKMLQQLNISNDIISHPDSEFTPLILHLIKKMKNVPEGKPNNKNNDYDNVFKEPPASVKSSFPEKKLGSDVYDNLTSNLSMLSDLPPLQPAGDIKNSSFNNNQMSELKAILTDTLANISSNESVHSDVDEYSKSEKID